MRKLQTFVDKYGPEFGPRYYHLLQSQAAHASVAARLRRKISALSVQPTPPASAPEDHDTLPLFPEPVAPTPSPVSALYPIADFTAVG